MAAHSKPGTTDDPWMPRRRGDLPHPPDRPSFLRVGPLVRGRSASSGDPRWRGAAGIGGSRAKLSWTSMAVDAPPAERLREQRRALPDQPGVYLFRDARGRVIYVGKAKSLRKRVASHFSNPNVYGTTALTDEIDHIEYLA